MLAMPWIATGSFVYQSFISSSKEWGPYVIAQSFMAYSILSVITLLVSGFLIDKFTSRKLLFFMNIPLLLSVLVLDKKRGLYFGVSLNGWKELLNKYNYEFVCVDKSGVNCFFILNDSLKIDSKDLYGEKFNYTKAWIKKFELPGNLLEKDLLSEFKGKLINIKTLL